MTLHRATGHWKLGVFFASITVLMWSTISLAMKIVAEQLDSFTISCFRFLSAFILMFLLQVAQRKKLIYREVLTKKSFLLFLVSILGLSGNYIFFVLAAREISPSSVQVLLQLGLVFLLVGSLVIFKEKLTRRQKFGFLILLIGQSMFLGNKLLNDLSLSHSFASGVIYSVISAFIWSLYALSQKQLLSRFSSQFIIMVIFAGSFLFLLPFASPNKILEMDPFHFYVLLYSGVNSFFAYGALSEAFNHLEASRVSGILSLSPLASVFVVEVVAAFSPSVVSSENLSVIGYVGAFCVVAGSIFISVKKTVNR